ncbi:MAG: tyrosine-type recombinase/integrase [Pseudonocardiales bacterium]
MSQDRIELAALLTSWELALRAERKSPQTVKTYGDGVRRFLTWADRRDRPPDLDRPTLARFVTALLDAGAEPATARSRQLAVRRFSAWLADEGEIERDELIGVTPPRLDQKLVHPLTELQIKALVGACTGLDQLRDRRDEALIRFMVETGARAGEVAALLLPDVNLQAGVATIRRGKGGRGRSVPIGPQTVRAIDRYLRARRTHRLAHTDALWLGNRGKEFSYDGLHKTLAMRAAKAGIVGFHPHVLRHSAADRWLAAGGSEGGLMTVAGWSRSDMLQRYTRARASDRAAAEARTLNLGDF